MPLLKDPSQPVILQLQALAVDNGTEFLPVSPIYIDGAASNRYEWIDHNDQTPYLKV